MIFRQLFEPLSCTYTYLLGCENTGQALLIDPVVNSMDRDLAELQHLGLTLAFTLDTHIHADHITGALHLRERVGSRIAAPAMESLPCADVGIEDGVPFELGEIVLHPLHTPGHTSGHFAYRLACRTPEGTADRPVDNLADRVFTGDALLIDGCGRTDFQNGDAATLYRSVHDRLFTLPGDCLVFPGHDYEHRYVSTIAQEKARNARLGGERSLAEFMGIMAALKLPYPKFIDHAVPGNRQCGVCPQDLPAQMAAYCGRMTESTQG